MKKYLFVRGAVLGIAVCLFAFTSNIMEQIPGWKKVAICHTPPGNPSNTHEINISEDEISLHLAHGDRLGSCSCKPRRCEPKPAGSGD